MNQPSSPTETPDIPAVGSADLLSVFLDLISGAGVKMVFWVCPKGCRGKVVWDDDRTDATCQVCGARRSDNAPGAAAAAETSPDTQHGQS